MINLFKKETSHKIKFLNVGQISFYLGVFFLSSALPIALFFFLISITIIIYKKRQVFFFTYDLLPLYLASFLILLSTYYSVYLSKPLELITFDTSISWFSIFKWINFIIIFARCSYNYF